ncbi:TetR/AcrR family transcriptional regulator [Glutamicibacter sp. NPDC087344]|uniref:TetR/AcrR family transcriptional regulator n=1 Tax=Glutamicibacter sp. NPDC087344 TaxID=3363994 RepID=UPI0037FED1E4
MNAAQGIITAQGTAAVTFEAVAEAAGVSRGGVLYHFANKTELLVALHEHLAERWEGELVDALGTQPEDASIEDRIATYAAASERSATGAELILMVEASLHGEMRAPYSRVAARWVPDAKQVREDDQQGLDQLIALLAADGLWASDLLTELNIPHRLRKALAQRIGEIARSGPLT